MRPGKFKHGYHAWTDAEVDLLFKLRNDDGKDWTEIGAVFGMPAQKCKTKYLNTMQRRRLESGHHFTVVPNAAAIDRENRAIARSNQSLTASVFGDPPPGYSALDRRRRA